eukprot:jgi/Ulvmu1/240/UM001_0244.1
MGIIIYVPLLVVYSLCESFIRCIRDVFSADRSVYTDFQYCRTPRNKHIVKQLQALREFAPPIWGRGPILQLFLAIMCPAADILYHPEVLQMNDGGDVILDWSSDPSQIPQSAPVLIVLHGIAGHSKEPYMRRTVSNMSDKGWTVVVYNRRGHRDKAGIRSKVEDAVDAEVSELACEVASPRFPEAAETPDTGPAAVSDLVASPDKQKRPWPMYSDLEDMHEVVQHVLSKGNKDIYAIGFSAGSNCLMKYVGETGMACPLKAAASVANGYDISNGLNYIRRNAWMLDRIIAHNLKLLFQKCSQEIELHGNEKIAPHDVKKCRSVLDIDTVITARLYRIDVQAYWKSQSCIASVPDTKIPLLCLNAMDDPLIDPTLVVAGHTFARQNENIVSVLTSHGGHLGWVSGWRQQWMGPAVTDYFIAVHTALKTADA